MASKSKHFILPLVTLSISLLFLITNYLFFAINYTRDLQDEFQNMTTYFKNLQHPEWFEIVSRETKEQKIIGLVDMNVVQTRVKKNTTAYVKTVQNPKWYEVVAGEIKHETIKIGLVNVDRGVMGIDYHNTNVKMVSVHFDRVGEDVHWSDLAPERMDENSTCPNIPMPRFEDYDQLDVVVARVSRCGDVGSRDVFRLQVNLVVANLLVRSGRKDNNRPSFVVFLESCEPMLEIFRCDDLLWNEGNSWVYKPEMERIKDLVLMPVGACQFVPPFSNVGKQQWRSHLPHQKEAYVTVLHTSEDYVCGAIVLAQSIIQSNSTKDLILLADNTISPRSISALRSAGWKTKRIQRIRSPYSKSNSYNEWNYSKLRIWQLKPYRKLIFIDADLLVTRNMDSLFGYPQLTAAGNYQKHLFNSGLMLIEPSECTFDALMRKMMVVESYNGGDQGFLNEMFSWWHRVPATMNYLKVFVDVKDEVHWVGKSGVYAVHYTGLKPWKCLDHEVDCNWGEKAFHRYASNSAHRMWWEVYMNMDEKLKPYCVGNGVVKRNGSFTSDGVKNPRGGYPIAN